MRLKTWWKAMESDVDMKAGKISRMVHNIYYDTSKYGTPITYEKEMDRGKSCKSMEVLDDNTIFFLNHRTA